MESLSHTTEDLIFEWDPEVPLVVDENIELPQFDLVENTTEDCSQSYSTGNFTCLEVVFVLKRRIGYFLFHTYMPTCLIVIMSWVSFWIKPEAAPARVTLGVTSLLTLSTQHAKSQASLPPVSYIKIIDMFMSMCTVFVFLALMEYALVNVILGDGPDCPSSQRPHEGPVEEQKPRSNFFIPNILRGSAQGGMEMKIQQPSRKHSSTASPESGMQAESQDRSHSFTNTVFCSHASSLSHHSHCHLHSVSPSRTPVHAHTHSPMHVHTHPSSHSHIHSHSSIIAHAQSRVHSHGSRQSQLNPSTSLHYHPGLVTSASCSHAVFNSEENVSGGIVAALPVVPPPPPPPTKVPSSKPKESVDKSGSTSPTKKLKDAMQRKRSRAIYVDRFSRVFFPVTFGIINGIYWLIFWLYL